MYQIVNITFDKTKNIFLIYQIWLITIDGYLVSGDISTTAVILILMSVLWEALAATVY